MTDVLKQVRRTIETHGLLTLPPSPPREEREMVVVGVSGGPDSLCLLHVLLRLRQEYHLRLHVAHLHHGARGADADADADFVAALATEWGLPITVERQDVPALARAHGLAFEETARRVRYTFLARVAGEVGAHKIAVGHNADDQAETVLMHFLRGAGPAGLRGMLPLTPLSDYRLIAALVPGPSSPAPVVLIRPLLEVPRAAIEAYCADQGLTPRFDRSNLDTTYFRNRLRHELLPLLATYNPNVRARLCHTAAVVAADYELLTQLRERAWAEVVREERKAAIVFDRATWRALPVALQRATLRQAAYYLRRSLRDVDFVHVENVRQVGLRKETGAQATLPMGLALTVGYDTLTMGDAGDVGLPPDEPLLWSAEPLPVQIPGTTSLPQSEWVLRAEVLEDLTPWPPSLRGKGETPPQGEEETPLRGEEKTPLRGEGETPLRGEGETPLRGKGETPPRGEGETPLRGEGETPPRGKGETPLRGKGETPLQGEGETPLPASLPPLVGEGRGGVGRGWGRGLDPWTACFDADALAGPLVLRSRRQGDRFRPQGMGGHSVKLSAFLINLKIPSAWRDHVPLFVAGDEIVWVCGRRLGEGVAIGPETRRVVRLRFERTF